MRMRNAQEAVALSMALKKKKKTVFFGFLRAWFITPIAIIARVYL